MSIQHAILGFLSWRPLTGYDLKKLFAGSEFFYWSGNSNQIYRALVQLHKEGLVTREVEHQESYPDRKVYALTAEGRAALRAWAGSAPEPPELRHTFLVQLAWADQLPSEELEALLRAYEDRVRAQLLICQEQARRGEIDPARTAREAYLWRAVADNWIGFYGHELAWVQGLRDGLAAFDKEEE
jgi:DNA-binding PadR family transcriptional regulator